MGKSKKGRVFESCFEKTLKAAGEGSVSAMIVLAPHPKSMLFGMAERGSFIPEDWVAPWLGREAPWLGAAVWVFPKHFQDELLEAGGGALFSHANCEPESNEAYLTMLGPVGARVAGSGWNSHAFANQGWPYLFDVGRFDLECGGESRSASLKKGDPRPSWWQPPMPLVKRAWNPEDPPGRAPDLGRVATALALQMRSEAAQAIFEETGAEAERSALALGTVVQLPARLARHFARQDHAMGGAPKLKGSDLKEALEALEIARTGFEAWVIGRESAAGAAPRPAMRV